jgi:hypothetical protein
MNYVGFVVVGFFFSNMTMIIPALLHLLIACFREDDSWKGGPTCMHAVGGWCGLYLGCKALRLHAPRSKLALWTLTIVKRNVRSRACWHTFFGEACIPCLGIHLVFLFDLAACRTVAMVCTNSYYVHKSPEASLNMIN